ncbi:D-Ala-D-Ala carboxypeptidase family metallohydrolase [Mesorhizobium sp. M0808]|uniref:ADP-ribosyltransferase-containing protein n=1 Tax=Mesorhizobium sp. M0808 TaxID=2957002 RepID=UPI00333E0CD4
MTLDTGGLKKLDTTGLRPAVAPSGLNVEGLKKLDTTGLTAMPAIGRADPMSEDRSVPFGSLARGFNRLQQAGTILQHETGIMSDEDTAKALVRDEADIARYPAPPAVQEGMKEISEAKSWGGAAYAILSNPQAVLSTIGESLPQSLAPLSGGIAGGAAGGAAGSVVPIVGNAVGATAGTIGGTFLGSFAGEYSSTIIDTMRNHGVDFNDDAAVAAAFKDPAIMADARNHALKRGIPVAAFDAISFGIAGKIGKPVAELAMQAGTGAAGEASAQYVDKGAITNPGDVLMEGAAEVVSGVPEIVVGRAREAKQGRIHSVNGVPEGALPAEQVIGADPESDAAINSRIDDAFTREMSQEDINGRVDQAFPPQAPQADIAGRIDQAFQPQPGQPVAPAPLDAGGLTPVIPPAQNVQNVQVPDVSRETNAEQAPPVADPSLIPVTDQPKGMAALVPEEKSFTIASGSADVAHVRPEVLDRFQQLQDAFGAQLPINSGFRDPERNAAAGGAKRSQHMDGNALDIDVRGMPIADRVRLIETASAAGFTGIGVYNNAIHIDLGARRYWGPSHSAESLPSWAADVIGRHMGGQIAQAPHRPGSTPISEIIPGANDTRPNLDALLSDKRKLSEIVAERKAIADFVPTAKWQTVPDGAPIAGLETRTENGVTMARFQPPAGTRESPLVIERPEDIHINAEQTAAPTPGQAEAGNYRKRHVEWQGMPIAIETEAGQERTGIDGSGKPWSVQMPAPYGYLKRTNGADGDAVDVYLGHENTGHVFVVDQIDPATGKFDEHKVMLGYNELQSAMDTYDAAFSDGSGPRRAGAVTGMTVAQFKQWLKNGDPKKPVAYSKPAAARGGGGVGATPDIVQFLAAAGGLQDYRGELRSLDLHNVFVPGAGRLMRSGGLTLDQAREMAEEAGYLGQAGQYQVSSIADLLNAIEATRRGQRIFARADQAKGAGIVAEQNTAKSREDEVKRELKQVLAAVGANLHPAELEEVHALIADGWWPDEAAAEVMERHMLAADAETAHIAPAKDQTDDAPFFAEDVAGRTDSARQDAAPARLDTTGLVRHRAQKPAPASVERGSTEPAGGQNPEPEVAAEPAKPAVAEPVAVSTPVEQPAPAAPQGPSFYAALSPEQRSKFDAAVQANKDVATLLGSKIDQLKAAGDGDRAKRLDGKLAEILAAIGVGTEASRTSPAAMRSRRAPITPDIAKRAIKILDEGFDWDAAVDEARRRAGGEAPRPAPSVTEESNADYVEQVKADLPAGYRFHRAGIETTLFGPDGKRIAFTDGQSHGIIDSMVATAREKANATKAEAAKRVAEPKPIGEAPPIRTPRFDDGKAEEQKFAPRNNEAITETPAFKNWFGESKVVDAQGKPLVVYHGTQANFEAFDPKRAGRLDSGFLGEGVYFSTDPDTANYYANSGVDEGQNIIPAYLSIKNPYMWQKKTRGVRGVVMQGSKLPDDLHDAVIERTEFAYDENAEWDAAAERDMSRALTEVLKERGYDGVIADVGGGELEIVAFEPTQIKSVNNRGTFDPADARISYAMRQAQPRVITERFKAADGGESRSEILLADSFADETDRIEGALRKELDRLGLTDVGLRLAQSIRFIVDGKAFPADGRYFRGLIDVALDAKNPANVLHHEALHALRRAGLFTEEEWQALSNTSMREWMERYKIAARYAGFPDWAQIEEGIAHAYADWATEKFNAGGLIARAFRKIRNFIEALGNALRGLGFKTSNDIFAKIGSGEIGNRPRSGSTDTVAYAIPSMDGDLFAKEVIETMDGPREQFVIPGAEKISDKERAERLMQGRQRSGKPQRDASGLPLFGDEKDQGSLFKLRREPQTTEDRQRVAQGFIARGQPIDRAMRLPFQLFGGIDKQGQWKPGLYLSDKTAKMLTSATFNPEGRFSWLNGPMATARAGLVDRYGLDPAYIDRERKRALDERSIMMDGVEVLKSLNEQNVGIEESKVLQAILTGEKVNDADMTKLAEPIRIAIDELGQEAVSLGLLSLESFERNRGAYLHRVYAKHEMDGGMIGYVSKLMTSRRQRIVGDQFKGRGIFLDVDAPRLVRDDPAWASAGRGKPVKGEKFRILDMMQQQGDLLEPDAKPQAVQRVYLPADKPVPEKYAGWRDSGIWEIRAENGGKFTLWRDYSKAERASMGEILDARYTIGKTYLMMAHDLATGRFFKDIAENEEWVSTAPPATKWLNSEDFSRRAIDQEVGWVKVPDTTIGETGGTKRWGALAGKYVRAEIWRDINEFTIMNKPTFWRKALTQWKLNKTARSPVVHMNNVMSNLMFMDFADIRMQDLAAGVKSFYAKDQHYREAIENGAFGGDMMTQEVRDKVLRPILDEIAKAESDIPGVASNVRTLSRVADRLWGWAKTADRFTIEAYRIEDELFRMATYMRRRQAGDEPAQAADFARQQFLDYDIRAPWVNAARNSVLPFISYTYRAVPLIARAMATRPWKLPKYFLIAYALNALAYGWDDDGDDEERERASLRDEEQGFTWLGVPRMMRMPFRDGNGMPMFLDIRRWIPAGDVFDTNQGSGALSIPAPIQFGGPMMMAAELALNKQAFTGDEITNELTDGWMDKAGKVGDYAWKSWMPSAAWVPGSWYNQKIINAYSGATDSKGRDYDMPSALASSVGIKVKGQDVEEGLFWHGFDMKKVEQELRAQARALGRQRERNLISQAEFERSMSSIMTKMDTLAEKRAELGRAAGGGDDAGEGSEED